MTIKFALVTALLVAATFMTATIQIEQIEQPAGEIKQDSATVQPKTVTKTVPTRAEINKMNNEADHKLSQIFKKQDSLAVVPKMVSTLVEKTASNTAILKSVKRDYLNMQKEEIERLRYLDSLNCIIHKQDSIISALRSREIKSKNEVIIRADYNTIDIPGNYSSPIQKRTFWQRVNPFDRK